MSDESPTENFESQTRELYRAVGEFAVKFEHVCRVVQMSIQFILDREGLKNQAVSQIILAGLTAEPLRTLLQSLLGEVQPTNDQEALILKNLFGRFQKLTETRNDLLHATTYIGWGSNPEDDFSQASKIKFHKDKSGAVVKSEIITATLLDSHTHEAEELASLFHRLLGCIVGGLSIEGNFVMDPTVRASGPTK